jgi:hypothetical protein
MGNVTLACTIAMGLVGMALGAQIPSGTRVGIRLGHTISSERARSGDTWTGTIYHRVVVNGQTVARRGDPVQGTVVNAKSSGRLSGRALLEIQLTSVNGIPVITHTISSGGKGHEGRNAKAIGGGAVAGALIGALAGGGKGAAIGAGAGAAVGTGGAAATGKKDVRFPVETILDFTVR